VSFEEAAAVPLTALTAWQAIFDTAGLQKGQSILIQGGAGGVGTMAVQLAKWKGAKIYATASTEHQDYLREIGVDVPIDYTKDRFEDKAKDMDVVLDAVGGETQARSYACLKKGGTLVSIVGPPTQSKAKEAGVTASGIMVKPNAEELRQIGDLVESRAIRPVVSQTLPLSEAAKAHQMIETHHTRAKIVLKVGE
jgi:NADPH:quinone reductase-like Zn-dependent oxidoreductase